MQPAFNRARLASYAAVMRDQASTTADSWRSGQVVDVYKEMNTIALSIVARTLCVTELPPRLQPRYSARHLSFLKECTSR